MIYQAPFKREITWWRVQMEKAQAANKHDLVFILWGITAGLMLAEDITQRAAKRSALTEFGKP
jgi:hypothetical protein